MVTGEGSPVGGQKGTIMMGEGSSFGRCAERDYGRLGAHTAGENL